MSAMRVLEAMARGAGRFGRGFARKASNDTVWEGMARGAGAGALTGATVGAITPEEDMGSLAAGGMGAGVALGGGIGAMGKLAQMAAGGLRSAYRPSMTELVQQLPDGGRGVTSGQFLMARRYLDAGDVQRAFALLSGQGM